MKTKIVLSRHWTPRVEAAARAAYDVVLNEDDRPLTPEELIQRCAGATVFCPTGTDQIDENLINRLPDTVKLIANFGAGTDHIDLAAAQARGLPVSNTAGGVIDATADLTFGLIIAACRRFAEGEQLMRADGWQGWAITFMLGSQVSGKTLGIVGMGGIGSAVARRARGFDMPVIYHNRKPNAEAEKSLGARYCETLEELLVAADIVALTCPLTEATYHLIGERQLAMMKNNAVLVNTARGPVVDEAALVRALQDGQIAAAGLDVYEQEPEIADSLRQLPNAFLLPHLGTATIEARDAMGMIALANIERFLADGQLLNPVAA